jgi:hypothetical protein
MKLSLLKFFDDFSFLVANSVLCFLFVLCLSDLGRPLEPGCLNDAINRAGLNLLLNEGLRTQHFVKFNFD